MTLQPPAFTNLLTAKPVAEKVYARVQEQVVNFKKKYSRPPKLVTVLVGEDPASQIYVKKKGDMCHELGLGHEDYKLSGSASEDELISLIKKLNENDHVDGILVQKPLPKQIREEKVFETISPLKDVDCFSPANVGLLSLFRPFVLPCTPSGVIEILKFYKIEIKGKNALVIGRSDIVGKPMALLLLQQDATVFCAHSKTKNLEGLIAISDIVVAAIGRPHFLKENLPWKKDAVVIDVGVNRTSEGKVVGDVDYKNIVPRVAQITPVPGGVGPMTIAMLMENTLIAAEKRMGKKQ